MPFYCLDIAAPGMVAAMIALNERPDSLSTRQGGVAVLHVQAFDQIVLNVTDPERSIATPCNTSTS